MSKDGAIALLKSQLESIQEREMFAIAKHKIECSEMQHLLASHKTKHDKELSTLKELHDAEMETI
eukprot:12855611-Ditylum_brightwellii.AAC.1